jgi:CTP:molybdopterin cytidylyltransferase MocA
VPEPVAGVLLAAGSGSRLGRPKALVIVGGQTLAHRGIALLRAGGTDPVIVVTGATGPDSIDGGGDTSPRTSEPGVISVHNPDWQTGMGSSVATGLGAVPAHCTAAVLALVDQPLISSEAVRRLLTAHAAGASVAVACYAGQPRNPVLISREHWSEVIALAVGDVGARPFLRAHPEIVTKVECGDIGRPDDVDSPDDLKRVEALLVSPAPLKA